MQTYPFLGVSKARGALIPFEFEDGPTMISEDSFMLARRIGAPVLKYGEVYRGSDIPGLYEGSIVEYDGKESVIFYSEGFKLRDLNDNTIKSIDKCISNFKVVSHIAYRPEIKIPRTKRILFKYLQLIFRLEDILGYAGAYLINREGGIFANEADIKLDAGVKHNNVKVYFGDTIDDSVVVLHNGQCCLFDGTSFKLLKGE